jgi:hypothetical protein
MLTQFGLEMVSSALSLDDSMDLQAGWAVRQQACIRVTIELVLLQYNVRT